MQDYARNDARNGLGILRVDVKCVQVVVVTVEHSNKFRASNKKEELAPAVAAFQPL